jgi:GNAT superfamily N-acetyltransferase
MRLRIRPCREDELDLIEATIPSPGRSRYHHKRYELQLAGLSTYLIAWAGRVPVGHLNLRRMSGEPDVAAVLGEVPEINALSVWPPERRNAGIGSALVLDAERRVREAGATQIGLGVSVENESARRLYDRLGYRDWGHGTVDSSYPATTEEGREVVFFEKLNYLVKSLL